MDSDPLVSQRRAQAGSRQAMLVQQVLHAMDAQTSPLGVGEQHLPATPLRLTQPGFQDGESGSGERGTTFLTPFSYHPHVGASSEDEVRPLEPGHLGKAQ